MTQKIVIIGCGWLGKQLASKLFAENFQVFGTRQSAEGLAELPAGVQPLLLKLPLDFADAALLEAFRESWLICAIPPSARQQSAEQYAQQLQSLVALAQQAGSRGMIHCSSTGVYQGLSGDVDEQSILSDHPRVRQLSAAEHILQQLPHCVTIRLAGLIGPGRNPARFGQGRTLSGPELPVNLVHVIDICQFVLTLLRHLPAVEHQVFNLCCPEHPEKAAFYHAAAANVGLPPVSFVAAEEPARRVLSNRSAQLADFSYQFQSPVQALAFC